MPSLIIQNPANYSARKITKLDCDAGQQLNARLAWERDYLCSPSEKLIFEIVQRFAALDRKICFASQEMIAVRAKCSRPFVNKILRRLSNVQVNGQALLKCIVRRNRDNGNYTNLYQPLNLSTGQYAQFDTDLLTGREKTQHYTNGPSASYQTWKSRKQVKNPDSLSVGGGVTNDDNPSQGGGVTNDDTNERLGISKNNKKCKGLPYEACLAVEKDPAPEREPEPDQSGAEAPFVFSNIHKNIEPAVESEVCQAPESLPNENYGPAGDDRADQIESPREICAFAPVHTLDMGSDTGYEEIDSALFADLLKLELPEAMLGLLKIKAKRCQRSPSEIQEACRLACKAYLADTSPQKYLFSFVMNALQTGDPMVAPARPTTLPKLPLPIPRRLPTPIPEQQLTPAPRQQPTTKTAPFYVSSNKTKNTTKTIAQINLSFKRIQELSKEQPPPERG